MEERKNPFGVPEGYFAELNERLTQKSKQKHVSSPKMFRAVASVAATVVLALSAWLVVFQDSKLDLRKTDTFASIFDTKAKQEAEKAEKERAEQLAWQKQKTELKAQAEEIIFTDEEVEYLNFFSEADDPDLLMQEEDFDL